MLEPQVVDGRRAGAREEQPYGSLRPACVWKSLSVAIVGKLQVYAVVEDEVELTMSAELHAIALRRKGDLMIITETNLM